MLNPAWRPAQTENPALDAIKHHYQHQPTDQQMVTSPQAISIPVIGAWSPDSSGDEITYLADALQRQLNLPGPVTLQHRVNWQLTLADTIDPRTNPAPAQLLIMVEAHLEALKAAYARVKQLLNFRDTNFSVIIQGARDTETARRYYRRLAMGSMRFLDLPLFYCGTAPRRGEAFSQGIATLAQKVRQSTERYATLHPSSDH